MAWRLQVGERTFELNPLLDDQELDSRRSVGTVYWEGAIRVSENGRPAGEGYLELAGYGDKIQSVEVKKIFQRRGTEGAEGRRGRHLSQQVDSLCFAFLAEPRVFHSAPLR